MGNKFKVGDRVKVIEATIGSYGANGENGTIIKKPNCDIDHNGLYFEDEAIWIKTENTYMDCGIWAIGIESKLKLLSQPSIHIYPNKTNTNETIAILKQGKEVIKTVSAICNPTDKYDFNKGAEIAFNRLIESKDVIQKPVEVREVKRKAEIGEIVRITKDDMSAGNCYQKGDIGKYIEDGVGQMRGGFVTTKWTHPCNRGPGTSYLYESEYVVLENYKPTKQTEILKFDLSLIPSKELIEELSKRIGDK